MTSFHSYPSPCSLTRKDGVFIYENDYIRWEHSAESGQLTGMYVKNGAGSNLLKAPLDSIITLFDSKTLVSTPYHRGKATAITADARGIRCTCGFADAKGGVLDGVTLTQEVVFGEWGEAEYTLTLDAVHPVEDLFVVRLLQTVVVPRIDTYTFRPQFVASCGKWSQNSCRTWRKLNAGALCTDFPVLESHIPLSMLMFEEGRDGFEFSIGDDIKEWGALGDYEECAFLYDKKADGYTFAISPYLGHEGGVLNGSHTFHFRLVLPYVRKTMAPLRPADNIYNHASFEKRWPTDEEYEAMKEAGYSLLRLHHDGDTYRNKMYWRDAIYPPYSPELMEDLDANLKRAASHGISVVPYFSVKEFHPDAPDFPDNAPQWYQTPEKGGSMRITRNPVSVYGGVMCLKSGWYGKRQSSIAEVLDKHPFKGIYFDWTCGIECWNDRHADGQHWDNDELLELLKWSHEKAGDGEFYLHTTHVPNLVAENMATLLLTEETAFPKLSPVMFTPHVHFLNTAPRQICDMLGADSSPVNRRKLGIAALLHHATVSSRSAEIVQLYAENQYWMKQVESYNRHFSPSSISSGLPDVGLSLYLNDQNDYMLVVGNMKETALETSVIFQVPGLSCIIDRAVSIPPLGIGMLKGSLDDGSAKNA